jgi:hypothetical protein
MLDFETDKSHASGVELTRLFGGPLEAISWMRNPILV